MAELHMHRADALMNYSAWSKNQQKRNATVDCKHWERDNPFYEVDGEKFDLFSSDCGKVADADKSYTWHFGPDEQDKFVITGRKVEAIRACVNAKKPCCDCALDQFQYGANDKTCNIPKLEARFAIVSRPDGNHGIAYTMINDTNVTVDFAEASECKKGYITPAFFVGRHDARLNPNGGFRCEWKDEVVRGPDGGLFLLWTKGYRAKSYYAVPDPKPWMALGKPVRTGRNLTPLTLVKNAVASACAKIDSGGCLDAQHSSNEILFVRPVNNKPSDQITEEEFVIAGEELRG